MQGPNVMKLPPALPGTQDGRRKSYVHPATSTPVEDFKNRGVRFLIGPFPRTVRLLLILFCLYFMIVLVASLAHGVGWGESENCSAPSYTVVLNAFLYLPYFVSGNWGCVPMGAPGQNLIEYFAYTSGLFAWTVGWWLFLSYALSRTSVAAVSWLSRIRSGPGTRKDG